MQEAYKENEHDVYKRQAEMYRKTRNLEAVNILILVYNEQEIQLGLAFLFLTSCPALYHPKRMKQNI